MHGNSLLLPLRETVGPVWAYVRSENPHARSRFRVSPPSILPPAPPTHAEGTTGGRRRYCTVCKLEKSSPRSPPSDSTSKQSSTKILNSKYAPSPHPLPYPPLHSPSVYTPTDSSTRSGMGFGRTNFNSTVLAMLLRRHESRRLRRRFLRPRTTRNQQGRITRHARRGGTRRR